MPCEQTSDREDDQQAEHPQVVFEGRLGGRAMSMRHVGQGDHDMRATKIIECDTCWTYAVTVIERAYGPLVPDTEEES